MKILKKTDAAGKSASGTGINPDGTSREQCRKKCRSIGFFRTLALVFLIFTVSWTLAGCGQKVRQKSFPAPASGLPPRPAPMPAANGVLPRPDPSFIAWLERQSMLGSAPGLAAQVSGSGRAFAAQGGEERVTVLLNAAPNWLWINPLAGNGPAFRQILAKNLVSSLSAGGLEGLFIAPSGESGKIWSSKTGDGAGWDVASFAFSNAAGTEEDFAKLAARAEDAGIQIGGELPPAATGLGPDFMLQARKAPRHTGLYAMIQVPQKDWNLLPAPGGDWIGTALDAKQTQSLAEILPEPFARDKASWASPGGWAATGEIMGADGKMRRWLYRYAKNPARPVMLWQDPSGEARNVFSAAIIQQTGLNGQTLTGIRLEPLLGLEAGESLEPGLEALEAMTREIHRYGGWAIQVDPLPLGIVAKLLAGPVDFCVDVDTESAAREAMTSGNARRLAEILRFSQELKLPHRRTARGAQQEEANLSMPEFILKNMPEVGDKSAESFADAWILGLSMRMGLPGLAMFSPEDLGLEGNIANIPRNVRENIEARCKNILQARKKSGLAGGELKNMYGGKDGWIAITSELPTGGYWLAAANYTQQAKKIALALPTGAVRALDAATGQEVVFDGQKIELALDAHKARHVVLYGK